MEVEGENMGRIVAGIALCALCGCFTVAETPRPASGVARVGKDVSLAVRGFEATVSELVPVYGYETYYVPPRCGRRSFRPGYYETVPSTTYVAERRPTSYYLDLATDRMEEAGLVVAAELPDYVMDVRFSGPLRDAERNVSWRIVQWLLTAFLIDRDAVTYAARVKIHDNRTGRLVFSRELTQTYDVSMVSLVPLFGPLFYERTGAAYMESWCLRGLTERAAAEAGRFFAEGK
jgi:hypothetical protein